MNDIKSKPPAFPLMRMGLIGMLPIPVLIIAIFIMQNQPRDVFMCAESHYDVGEIARVTSWEVKESWECAKGVPK